MNFWKYFEFFAQFFSQRNFSIYYNHQSADFINKIANLKFTYNKNLEYQK